MAAGAGWRAEGFDHVAVGVADLAAARRWYVGVLGMEDFMQHEPTFVGPELAFLRQGCAKIKAISSHSDAA
jgi:catechol 2,3-dioxygenase-like lactoylglutathione lyase family enzyme